MSKADNALMEALHGATVQLLIERIQAKDASAADLQVARNLLKDSGICADPSALEPDAEGYRDPIAGLAEAVKELEKEEVPDFNKPGAPTQH